MKNNIRSLIFNQNIDDMMRKDLNSMKTMDSSTPNHVRCNKLLI
jgi:hypothetical protein